MSLSAIPAQHSPFPLHTSNPHAPLSPPQKERCYHSLHYLKCQVKRHWDQAPAARSACLIRAKQYSSKPLFTQTKKSKERLGLLLSDNYFFRVPAPKLHSKYNKRLKARIYRERGLWILMINIMMICL